MATQSPSTNPIHEELTSNDLALLLNTLSPVAYKCHILGLQLGVTYPQLRNIEHNYRKCEDQLHEIIAERLKQEPALTWCDIVTALKANSVREYSLASEIEHKYIHCQPPSASVPPQVSTESSVSLATSLLTSAQSSLPIQSISQCPTSPLANRESSLSVNTQSHLTPSQPSLHTSPSTQVIAQNTHHLIPVDTHHPVPPGQISTARGNTASDTQTTASASSYSTASTDAESDTSTHTLSNELFRNSSYCFDNTIDRHTGALTDTISGDLTSFSNTFIELGFFTRPAADNILTKHGIGDRDKASQLLGLVTKNYILSRDKKNWFDKFVSVFSSEAAYADLATSLLTSAQSSLPTQSISQYPTSPLANRESSLSVSHLTPSQPSLHDQHTSPSTQVIAPNTYHLIPRDTHHPRPPGHTSTALQAGPVLPPHFQPSLHSQSTGMQCPHPSGTTLQLYHSISPLQYPPPQPHTHHPHYQTFPPQYQSYYHPPHPPQHMSPSTVSQSVSSSDQFSCSSSSAVVASGPSLSHSAVGSIPASGNSSPQTAHTTPQVQPPSMQPHAHDMTSHVGWSTPYGHPSYMYPPHQIPPYLIAHTPQPYPNTPYMLAQTNIPPLQEEVVGGQWNSQLHMSHSEPQSQRQSGSSSVDSRPPPAKRVYLEPNTQPHNQSHIQSSSSGLVGIPVKSTEMKSPMDKYIHYIKATYKQCEIEKSLNAIKWPPTPSKVFINLACIDWETVVTKEEADECTRAMVEDGNVDVIMKKKRNIGFDDIVRDLPATAFKKVVLVEGAPGVGKSTFAWEFCRRWERGEIAQQYQLVLLLRLRDDRMSRAKSLKDLIYHPLEDICHFVEHEVVDNLGVNVLIILEGFDELPDFQRREPSVFLQLILGQLLPFATILLTSRPWATSTILTRIRHRIFQHVEVLGFTEENIRRYVTSVFTDEKTASAIEQSVAGPDEVSEEAKKNIDDVMTYLATYPQIKACMYIPLNAAIVVSIHQESKKGKCILPKTLTELYYALTQVLLLRYLYGHPEYSQREWNVHSFQKDLPAEMYTQLLSISKLAYDGICTMQEETVRLIFSDLPAGFETLGFMQSVAQVYVQHGQKMSHNFLHLTVQEFLAARHISTMSPAEQVKHFQWHKEGRLRVVLRFLAGITELKNVTHEQLRGLLGEPDLKQNDEQQTRHFKPMRPDVCIEAHHTNWLFEAQNTDLLQSVLHNHTASYTFTKAMLPLEYYSVGYCIAHSHSNWSLTFEEDTEEEKLHMLVSGAETGDNECKVALKTISMTSEKLNVLLNVFASCLEEIYYLRIPDNGSSLAFPLLPALHILELGMYNSKSTFNVSCDFPFQSLESLTIRSSNHKASVTLGVKTCKAIGRFLSSSTSLKELRLHSERYDHKWSVRDKGIEAITKCMSDNTALPLKSLEINCMCTFTTTTTRSLAQFITRSSTMQYLKLYIAEIEDVGTFTKSISDNIALPLKSLEIDCKCTFTTTATRSLAQFISKSTTLQYLKLCIANFEDVDTFTKGMSDNTALPLKSLEIDCKCTFTTTTTRSLAHFITRSTTLQYLRLCSVTFSAQNLIELAEAIHHSSSLQEKKLEELLFHVECSEDVASLKHMFNDHPDMQDSIDWNKLTEIHKSITENNAMEASVLTLALEHIVRVTILYWSSNDSISDAGAVALAQALHHNSTLKELHLSNNSISDAGVVALAQALHHNSTLKELYLYNNSISDAGAVALAQALHHNSTLKRLDLCNNSISDTGAVALAQALHHNSTLKELYLSNNSISDAGAVALAQALHHNSTLERLYLHNNSISDAGAVALAQALHHNSTLERLGLFSNDAIGEEGTCQLVQSLTVNTSISSLSLPKKCTEYATQCREYDTVKDRIQLI